MSATMREDQGEAGGGLSAAGGRSGQRATCRRIALALARHDAGLSAIGALAMKQLAAMAAGARAVLCLLLARHVWRQKSSFGEAAA